MTRWLHQWCNHQDGCQDFSGSDGDRRVQGRSDSICPPVTHWSWSMILAYSARGPGVKSLTRPWGFEKNLMFSNLVSFFGLMLLNQDQSNCSNLRSELPPRWSRRHQAWWENHFSPSGLTRLAAFLQWILSDLYAPQQPKAFSPDQPHWWFSQGSTALQSLELMWKHSSSHYKTQSWVLLLPYTIWFHQTFSPPTFPLKDNGSLQNLPVSIMVA